MQISCIVEDVTKSISKSRKLEHQTKNRFQTKFCLEKPIFVSKLKQIFFQRETKPKECLYCQEIWKYSTREISQFHTSLLYCWRRNQISFKIVQIRTVDKKLFSNQIVSRKLFVCARTARKLCLKVCKAKGMLLLFRNLKIQYPRNSLIPFKSPVLWKTQPKLFQNCASRNTRQKTVFKPNCV